MIVCRDWSESLAWAPAFFILTSADVVELVTAPAGHVVAALVLNDPVFAARAALGACLGCPLLKLIIGFKVCIVDLFCSLAVSVLSACVTLMPGHVALMTPGEAADRAIVSSDFFDISSREEVVAGVVGALDELGRVCISDRFPLKPL